MNEKRRAFIAHPRQISDADLTVFVERVRCALEAANAAGREIEIVTGRDSAEGFKAKSKGPFNWSGWIDHVCSTLSPFDTTPRFHYFIAGPDRVIGRATAQLLVKAHNLGRKIFALNDAGQLVSVRSITTIDAESWKDGWRVEV